MKNISSFFLSIMIHILLVALLAASYFSFEKKASVDKSPSEKLLCINLATYHPCLATKKEVQTKPKQQTTRQKSPKNIKQRPKKEIQQKKKIEMQKVKKPKTTTVQPSAKTKVEEKKKEQTENHQKTSSKDIKQKNTVTKQCIKTVTTKKKQENYSTQYISKNISIIRKLIAENLYYPRKARRRHIQGTVKVRFTLTQKGKIENIQLLSYPADILAKSSITTLKNIENKLPKPKEEITITLPIVYKLLEE